MYHKKNAVILWRNCYIFICVVLVSLRDYNSYTNILRVYYFSNFVMCVFFPILLVLNMSIKFLLSFILVLVHQVKLDEN